MKTLFLFLSCTFLFFTSGQCQNAQNDNIYDLKSDVLYIESNYLDINIQTWEKDFIEMKSEVKINLGLGDDKHELRIDNLREGIKITSYVDTEAIDKMVITTDKEGNKTYTPIEDWDENKKGRGYNSLNFGYEIDGSMTLFVPENMKLNIETTYGDVFINGDYDQIETHSTYGLVEAKLEDVSNMNQISLKSTYDIIDLTLDESSNASLNLQTSYGSVFTDLPLQINQTNNKKSSQGCSQFSERYVLNNGDTNIDIVATYDNIYVRSK